MSLQGGLDALALKNVNLLPMFIIQKPTYKSRVLAILEQSDDLAVTGLQSFTLG